MEVVKNRNGREKPAVLVVDDEEEVLRVLVRGLGYAGYQTQGVQSGAEALEHIQTGNYQAMLTDIHMPRMRGDELQRRARELEPDLAVLMITAAGDVSCAVECLKEGVFDYMLKPFDLEDVALRIEKALERRQLVLQNRDYQLNLEKRVAEQTERIRQMMQHSLQALNTALEVKDEFNRDHAQQVADMAVAMAACLRPTDTAFQSKIRLAALFHDIGNIGVPEALLHKTEKLTLSEFATIQKHVEIGEEILRPFFPDPEVLSVIRSHHEHWDGSGYPDKLAGEAIPLGARIVAVATAYDAMTRSRPYRPGMAQERAFRILREGAGRQWDPEIIVLFLEGMTGNNFAA
jgi:putative two-component system response regulator